MEAICCGVIPLVLGAATGAGADPSLRLNPEDDTRARTSGGSVIAGAFVGSAGIAGGTRGAFKTGVVGGTISEATTGSDTGCGAADLGC